jgi:Reverse transcriptase (RNA-dependent DNA polymerase)
LRISRTQASSKSPFSILPALSKVLDAVSPLIFNVVLESIVRRAKLQTNGTIFNKQTQILGYADDIDIIGQATVREAFSALEREANKVELKINESKSVAFGDKECVFS